MAPPSMLGGCRTLNAARSLLLRTEFIDGEGWVTRDDENLERLVDVPCASAPLPSSVGSALEQKGRRSSCSSGDDSSGGSADDGSDTWFTEHTIYTLPDRSKSAVHRFSLNPSDARTKRMHGRIAAEAKWLAPWLSFGGVTRSNAGGFHSNEQAFRAGVGRGAWYKTLHEEVFLPALRTLDGGAEPATVRYEDSTSVEPRIGGWLNASGVHDFNYLHSHGADVAWSLVYYVQSGQPAPSIVSSIAAPPYSSYSDSSSTPSAAPPEHDAGSLLLKVRREVCGVDANGDGGGDGGGGDDASIPCYFAIHPVEGELWAIPGDMHHCVMPREVPKRGLADALGRASLGLVPWLRKPLRISVAANVYAMTSAYRDKVIGFHRAAPASSESQQHSGSIAGCVVPCVSPRK